MVYVLTVAFILMDLVTGLIKAFKEKEYTSTLMREGLYHKFGSCALMGFGALVDYSQGYIDLGVLNHIGTPICIYITLMEIGSIIENLGKINPNIVPGAIRSYFRKLNA